MEFKELILERRSIRKYQEVNIEIEEIKEIIKDALLAPSWKNGQPARYYVANSKEYIDKIKESLPDFNANSSNNANLVVTTFKKGLSGFNPDGTPTNELGDLWGAYDLGLANAYFILAAKEKDYDTLIMGIRDADKIRQVFDIPEDEIIVAIIALGKKDIDAKLNPRKELDEVLVIK